MSDNQDFYMGWIKNEPDGEVKGKFKIPNNHPFLAGGFSLRKVGRQGFTNGPI